MRPLHKDNGSSNNSPNTASNIPRITSINNRRNINNIPRLVVRLVASMANRPQISMVVRRQINTAAPHQTSMELPRQASTALRHQISMELHHQVSMELRHQVSTELPHQVNMELRRRASMVHRPGNTDSLLPEAQAVSSSSSSRNMHMGVTYLQLIPDLQLSRRLVMDQCKLPTLMFQEM